MAQRIETFSDGLAALLHHIVDLNLASDITPPDIEFINALEMAVTQRLRKPAIESLQQAGINPEAIQQGGMPGAGLPPMSPGMPMSPGGMPGGLEPSMNGVMPQPSLPNSLPNMDEFRRQLS